ncbi:glycoside hydrolase family 16 protein [Nocardioides sp. J2M5]|uniref:glycoside hydrolase family 16 protein n=1 Tax=Nocardioides palaemonis TaxID=2829810 RepID=UPI001BA5CBD5|nr:glycoside hydrolase family 16 protein [Nocardioides palaemonis]MBS2938422.1 glycoside hydrolase family 16 protein [Nocardioides palaemonis]
MSPRPVRRLLLAALAVALLGPVALQAPTSYAAGDGEEAAPSSSLQVTPHQRVRLEVLPPVVQRGRDAAAADAARSPLVVTARPARQGRRVRLQVLRDGTWDTLATRRQDGRGRVEMAAATSADGHALTYRVRVMATRGLRGITSRPVSTQPWLRPSFGDEFSGTSVGPSWSTRSPEVVPGSRRSCAKGDPDAVRVEGGTARLSVLVDPDATGRCRIRGRDQEKARGSYAYRLNGHIGTEGRYAFRYGVAAARVRFHRMRGQHGAFWLQPASGMYPGAAGSEIDVVEYFGDHHPQGGLATFMHRYEGRRRVSSGGWVRDQASFLGGPRDGWSRNFHVFSVEWRPRLLVFRIDGRETGRMRRGVSAVDQFPILSLISADYELPKIKERHLPQHMEVDWVRVWETGAPGAP